MLPCTRRLKLLLLAALVLLLWWRRRLWQRGLHKWIRFSLIRLVCTVLSISLLIVWLIVLLCIWMLLVGITMIGRRLTLLGWDLACLSIILAVILRTVWQLHSRSSVSAVNKTERVWVLSLRNLKTCWCFCCWVIATSLLHYRCLWRQ
jgi:hypothetical protein